MSANTDSESNTGGRVLQNRVQQKQQQYENNNVPTLVIELCMLM